jgi:hypothetical protein
MIERLLNTSTNSVRDQATGSYVASLSSDLGLICLKSDQPSNEFFSFAVRKLVDSRGNEATGLDSSNWNFRGPETGFHAQSGMKYQKYSAVVESSVINLRKDAIGKAKIELIVEFYSNSGLIKYGDDSIRVFPGSVKFSCNISSWPFESLRTDRLLLGLSAVSSGEGGIAVKDDSRLFIGDGFLEMPLFALKDGSLSSTPIQVMYDRKSSNQALVLLSFPAFSNHIYYDPVASLSSNEYAKIQSASDENPKEEGSKTVIYVSVGVGVSALVGIIAGFVFFKRRSSTLTAAAESTFLPSKRKGKFVHI